MKSYFSVSVALLSVFLSTTTLAAIKAPTADNKIARHVLVIAGANDEWTSTTIKVAPGDILLVRASGEIKVGSYLGQTGPDGTNNGIGQLQLKIGASSVQAVGSTRYVQITEAGTAKLRIYDTNYRDNSGEFNVEVIYIPAAIIPEPTPVSAE